jgi:hypothetical protein
MAFFFLTDWLDADRNDLYIFTNSITLFVTMFAGRTWVSGGVDQERIGGHGRISPNLSVEETQRCR